MKNVKVTMATSILEYTYQGHLKLKQLGKCYYDNQYIRVHITVASVSNLFNMWCLILLKR